jgi:hypothetical protein
LAYFGRISAIIKSDLNFLMEKNESNMRGKKFTAAAAKESIEVD